MKREDLGGFSGLGDGVGVGRRRWSVAAKRAIVLESQTGPGAIGATARRHGISRSQLMAWRRAFPGGPDAGSSGFMPVTVRPKEDADMPVTGAAPESGVANVPVPDKAVPDIAAPFIATSAISPVAPAFGRVEIVLVCGRRLVLDGAMDTDAVLGLARGLERLS
jgi:transposase